MATIRGSGQAQTRVIPKSTSKWWQGLADKPPTYYSDFSSFAFWTELLGGINLLGKPTHYIPNSPVRKLETDPAPKCYPAIVTKVVSMRKDMIIINLIWTDTFGQKHPENGVRYQGFIDRPTGDPWLYPNFHNENHFPSLYPPQPVNTGTYQSQPVEPQYTFVRVPDAPPSSTYSGCTTISDATLNGGDGTTICWDNGVETFRAVGLSNEDAGQAQIDFNNGKYRQGTAIPISTDMIKTNRLTNTGVPYVVEAWDNDASGLAGVLVGQQYWGASAVFPNLRQLGLRIPPEIQPPLNTNNIPTMCQQDLASSKTCVIQYIASRYGAQRAIGNPQPSDPITQIKLGIVYDCSGNDYWIAWASGLVNDDFHPNQRSNLVFGQGSVIKTASSHALTFFTTVEKQSGSDHLILNFVVDSITVCKVDFPRWGGGESVIVGVENRNNMTPSDANKYGPIITIPDHTITNMRYYIGPLSGTLNSALFSGKNYLINSRPELRATWASASSILIQSIYVGGP